MFCFDFMSIAVTAADSQACRLNAVKRWISGTIFKFQLLYQLFLTVDKRNTLLFHTYINSLIGIIVRMNDDAVWLKTICAKRECVQPDMLFLKFISCHI